jgi:hypothetical protein
MKSDIEAALSGHDAKVALEDVGEPHNRFSDLMDVVESSCRTVLNHISMDDLALTNTRHKGGSSMSRSSYTPSNTVVRPLAPPSPVAPSRSEASEFYLPNFLPNCIHHVPHVRVPQQHGVDPAHKSRVRIHESK